MQKAASTLVHIVAATKPDLELACAVEVQSQHGRTVSAAAGDESGLCGDVKKDGRLAGPAMPRHRRRGAILMP